MALTSATISSAILSAGADLAGPTFPLLCNAIGTAVFTWSVSPTNLGLSGTTSGTIGAGVVTGKITLAPNIAALQTALTGQSIVGVTAPRLAKAVAIGISTSFSSSAQYTGSSVGVAIGSDTSFVAVSNPVTLIPIMISSMTSSFGGIGLAGGSVATALSNGIATLLQGAQGFGAVVGTPTAAASAVGTSPLSKVF